MSTFLKKLQCVNGKVVSRYNDAFFYEAQLQLLKGEDGNFTADVDWTNSKLIWGTSEGDTIIATFNGEGKPYFQEVGEPWLEDRPMTPYIPCDLKDAIDRLGQADFLCDSPYCTLRFQLLNTVSEPQWFFGTPDNCHTVGVYTADVK